MIERAGTRSCHSALRASSSVIPSAAVVKFTIASSKEKISSAGARGNIFFSREAQSRIVPAVGRADVGALQPGQPASFREL